MSQRSFHARFVSVAIFINTKLRVKYLYFEIPQNSKNNVIEIV